MRNLFARAVGHLGDETPVLVIFNADVFGSLFVAYCMHSSPSFWATMELMVVDISLMGLSLRDIERARKGLGGLERKVDNGYMWASYHGEVGHISLGGRIPTTLERASIFLEREAQQQGADGSRSSRLLQLTQVPSDQEREGPTLVAKSAAETFIERLKAAGLSGRIYPVAGRRGIVKEVREEAATTYTGSRTLSVQEAEVHSQGAAAAIHGGVSTAPQLRRSCNSTRLLNVQGLKACRGSGDPGVHVGAVLTPH